MANRINRAIELLEADQAIYYDGPHTGHVLTYEQGRKDARTWADYINVGMEHGAFDMTGLEDYMRGLVDGGPTNSGHRTPTVIVEAPVNGIDGPNVAFNAWQFRQILARGVHGILLCQAESADAVREFVRACRFPHHKAGIDKIGIGTVVVAPSRRPLPSGALISKSISSAASPGRSIPKGELLLGVKIESPPGVAHCEEILAVPGLGFAELGPGDLGLSLGYTTPAAPALPARDGSRPRQGLRRLQEEQARLPGGRHAGQDRRQPGRRRAGDLRPQSRSGQGRSGASKADDAGMKPELLPLRCDRGAEERQDHRQRAHPGLSRAHRGLRSWRARAQFRARDQSRCAGDRRRASTASSRRRKQPLAGVPILVKDNIATGDKQHTTAGSLALATARAPGTTRPSSSGCAPPAR